jgi:hypothetical protein
MTFPQKMKKRVLSKAFPGPINGPHQSSTSALPVNAWQMTMTLSPRPLSFPHVLYATGTSFSLYPDSSSNSGIVTIDWFETSFVNGDNDDTTDEVTGILALRGVMDGG